MIFKPEIDSRTSSDEIDLMTVLDENYFRNVRRNLFWFQEYCDPLNLTFEENINVKRCVRHLDQISNRQFCVRQCALRYCPRCTQDFLVYITDLGLKGNSLVITTDKTSLIDALIFKWKNIISKRSSLKIVSKSELLGKQN